MSSLVLVRHGQASFLEENYDRLSAKGEQQARLLAEYWIRHGDEFDLVFTGPRIRQVRTAEIVAEEFRKAELPWPETFSMPELDECQADLLVSQHLDEIAESYPHVRAAAANFRSAKTNIEKTKTYQRMFESIMNLWIHGAIQHPNVEPWSVFVDRVMHGIRAMTAHRSSGTRIAAFTSGGPTAIAMQMVLRTEPRVSLGFMWTKRNCALTEFLFTRNRMTLNSFNAVPHLPDRSLWTYR